MQCIEQVISFFRIYNTLREDGIPSVLELFHTSTNNSMPTMQNDRSVRSYADMGSKVIRCITHEEELKSAFSKMESTLASIEPQHADLLMNYYCHGKSKSEALKLTGQVHRDSFKYAQALFALHHPDIDFGKDDFDSLCNGLKWIEGFSLSVNNVKDLYSEFKNMVMACPDKTKEQANMLPPLRDVPNSFFIETTQSDRQFFRDRNTLLVALFYIAYPYIDFSVICEVLKSEQGAKRFLATVDRNLHQEDF